MSCIHIYVPNHLERSGFGRAILRVQSRESRKQSEIYSSNPTFPSLLLPFPTSCRRILACDSCLDDSRDACLSKHFPVRLSNICLNFFVTNVHGEAPFLINNLDIATKLGEELASMYGKIRPPGVRAALTVAPLSISSLTVE